MKIKIDFSERIIVGSDKRDGELKYEFTSNFQLFYSIPDLRKDMIFSCEPVTITNQCERNFLQVRNRHFDHVPTPFPHESLLGTI